MIVERLAVEHFNRLRVQPAQRAHAALLTDAAYQRALVEAGGYAGLVDDGAVLAVAGLIDQGGGRALAWSWLGEGIGAQFVALDRIVRRQLEAAAYRRVEMIVDPQNANAVRWARLLGFQCEASLRSWFPNGGPALLFARVQ